MNTSEGALTVIGELRNIITQKEKEILELRGFSDRLQMENSNLQRELSHVTNALRNISENLLKDTTPAK